MSTGLSFDIQLILRGFVDQKLYPFQYTTVKLSSFCMAQLWRKIMLQITLLLGYGSITTVSWLGLVRLGV